MIHRIIYEDWPLIFPALALLVATMVYLVAACCNASLTAARAQPAESPDRPGN